MTLVEGEDGPQGRKKEETLSIGARRSFVVTKNVKEPRRRKEPLASNFRREPIHQSFVFLGMRVWNRLVSGWTSRWGHPKEKKRKIGLDGEGDLIKKRPASFSKVETARVERQLF